MVRCTVLPMVFVSAVAVFLETDKERPVMKVVRLLEDMRTELNRDLEDDKAVHNSLDCWCKENDREKTAAIETGQAKETELESFLGEAAARMEEFKSKRDAALDEVNNDEAATQEASTLRMKENQAFHADEVNLVEAIKACDQALTVLGKHNVQFAQVRDIVQQLQRARVLELGGSSASASGMLALRAFLTEQRPSGSSSFLAIPGYQSYAPQSGQIFGVLQQLKEDFERDLAAAQGKEKSAAAEHTALKAAKTEEIKAGRMLQENLDQQIAELKEKHAEAFTELEDTQQQLVLDRTFLASLKKKCSESDTEFDKRVKDRFAEIAAVEDTIKILNTDKAFDNFDKTVNSFVQLSSVTAEQQVSRATAVLLKAAAATGSPALSLLASRAQLDTFVKVKQEIDKMVEELKRQQQDEIEHRDWCIAGFSDNERAMAEQNDDKESLQSTLADLKKSIAYLSKEIEAATAAVAEMQKQMKRASENREAENADYQQTVSDQRVTQTILTKALKRMKQVYALLEQPEGQPGAPHIHTSGNHTDAGNGPARFDKYQKHAGGGKVLAMLQTVLADSRKAEADAIASEQDAQGAYENFMKDSNKGITVYTEKISHLKGSRAADEESLAMAKADLKATVAELGELHDENGNLHKSCDFVMNTFDERQAARTAEVDALNEAKAILSGMK